MALEFAQITATKLQSLPAQQTVFFFPVGPLEDHGPHLPMGMDLIEATTLCRMAAERMEREMPGWVGVVMPAAPIGVSANTSKIALTVRPYVLRDWLADCAFALIRQGFVHFVCFTGQMGPRQLTAIEDAGKQIARRLRRGFGIFRRGRTPALVSASSALVPGKEVLRSPFWSCPVEHGGARDTSIALAVAPQQVDSYYMALPGRDAPLNPFIQVRDRLTRALSGYWGSPAQAASQAGMYALNGTLEEVFPKLRVLWQGTPYATRQFRSWYSVLPPNYSNFRGWVLAGLIILVLVSWLLVIGLALPE